MCSIFRTDFGAPRDTVVSKKDTLADSDTLYGFTVHGVFAKPGHHRALHTFEKVSNVLTISMSKTRNISHNYTNTFLGL